MVAIFQSTTPIVILRNRVLFLKTQVLTTNQNSTSVQLSPRDVNEACLKDCSQYINSTELTWTKRLLVMRKL